MHAILFPLTEKDLQITRAPHRDCVTESLSRSRNLSNTGGVTLRSSARMKSRCQTLSNSGNRRHRSQSQQAFQVSLLSPSRLVHGVVDPFFISHSTVLGIPESLSRLSDLNSMPPDSTGHHSIQVHGTQKDFCNSETAHSQTNSTLLYYLRMVTTSTR